MYRKQARTKSALLRLGDPAVAPSVAHLADAAAAETEAPLLQGFQ
jgi:hypothetical protein